MVVKFCCQHNLWIYSTSTIKWDQGQLCSSKIWKQNQWLYCACLKWNLWNSCRPKRCRENNDCWFCIEKEKISCNRPDSSTYKWCDDQIRRDLGKVLWGINFYNRPIRKGIWKSMAVVRPLYLKWNHLRRHLRGHLMVSYMANGLATSARVLIVSSDIKAAILEFWNDPDREEFIWIDDFNVLQAEDLKQKHGITITDSQFQYFVENIGTRPSKLHKLTEPLTLKKPWNSMWMIFIGNPHESVAGSIQRLYWKWCEIVGLHGSCQIYGCLSCSGSCLMSTDCPTRSTLLQSNMSCESLDNQQCDL